MHERATMITEPLRNMLREIKYVFLATADSVGQPHIAIGEQVTVSGDSFLIFENWFCPTTLQNINSNTRVAVVAVLPGSDKGFQLLGEVVRSTNTAMLDGYDASITKPELPQVLTRFIVRVKVILEFSGGIHTDIPLNVPVVQ